MLLSVFIGTKQWLTIQLIFPLFWAVYSICRCILNKDAPYLKNGYWFLRYFKSYQFTFLLLVRSQAWSVQSDSPRKVILWGQKTLSPEPLGKVLLERNSPSRMPTTSSKIYKRFLGLCLFGFAVGTFLAVFFDNYSFISSAAKRSFSDGQTGTCTVFFPPLPRL